MRRRVLDLVVACMAYAVASTSGIELSRDDAGRIVVTTPYLTWEPGAGSVLDVRTGGASRNWRDANAYPGRNWGNALNSGTPPPLYPYYYIAGALGGTPPTAPIGTFEVFSPVGLSVPSGDSVYAGPEVVLRCVTKMCRTNDPDDCLDVVLLLTFRDGESLVRVDYDIQPYDSGTLAFFWGISMLPGGDMSSDYLHVSGQTGEIAVPYGSWLSVAESALPEGFVYASVYDKCWQQGIACIAQKEMTRDFLSDRDYGRIMWADAQSHAFLQLHMTTESPGSFYLYFFEVPETGDPWSPVDDMVGDLARRLWFEERAPGDLDMFLSSPEPTAAAQAGFRIYGPGTVAIRQILPGDAVQAAGGAEYWYSAIEEDGRGAKVGLILSTDPASQVVRTVPEGTHQEIIRLLLCGDATGCEVRFVSDVSSRRSPITVANADGRSIKPSADGLALQPGWRACFMRGDANTDGRFDIADPVKILGYLFGRLSLACADAADTNDSGVIDIADPITALGWLFANGPDLPPPFPVRPGNCGPDSTRDQLTCASYSPCTE